MKSTTPYAITTIPGFEEIAAAECKIFGYSVQKITRGAVQINGDKAKIGQLLLRTRTILRVLDPIFEGSFTNQKEFDTHIARFSWERYIRPKQTFKINTVGRAGFASDRFLTLRIKDSIVDALSSRYGKRPSIDTRNPDITFVLYLDDSNVIVYRDAAGAPLSIRGYRTKAGDAPLNEIIATGIAQLIGWQGEGIFIDPMCGSGTIAIEAALLAKNFFPQQYRPQGFAIASWPDKKVFGWPDTLSVQDTSETTKAIIIAADSDLKMITLAKENARRAGVLDYIHFIHTPFEHLHQRIAGLITSLPNSTQKYILMNPPYDKRLALSNQPSLYTQIGDTLKQHWAGAAIGIFTANREEAKKVGLRTSAKHIIQNGPLDCRLLEYKIH